MLILSRRWEAVTQSTDDLHISVEWFGKLGAGKLHRQATVRFKIQYSGHKYERLYKNIKYYALSIL